MADDKLVRRTDGTFHWEEVDVRAYRQEADAPFRDVTRQVLFEDADLPAELRYFEVAPGGHTTLERHEHVHAVMVIRGRGQCLVGETAHDIALHDLVRVPPMTWHQFRAAKDEPLGFLCMVAADRDRPQLPSADEAETIARPFTR
jgi:mannose-6-phosphate isomerase-like protein (cupin superfamily)